MPRGGPGRKFKKREELARVGAVDRLRELRKQKDKLDAEIIEILELYPEFAKGLPGDERPVKRGRAPRAPEPIVAEAVRPKRTYKTEETRARMQAILKLRAELWGSTKRPADWPQGAKVVLMAHKRGLPIPRILRRELDTLLAKETMGKRPQGRPRKAVSDPQPVLPLAGRPESGRPEQSKPWHHIAPPGTRTTRRERVEAARARVEHTLEEQHEARAAYEAQRQAEEKEQA